MPIRLRAVAAHHCDGGQQYRDDYTPEDLQRQILTAPRGACHPHGERESDPFSDGLHVTWRRRIAIVRRMHCEAQTGTVSYKSADQLDAG